MCQPCTFVSTLTSLESSWRWVLQKHKLQFWLSQNIRQTQRVRSQLIQILLIQSFGDCSEKWKKVWAQSLMVVPPDSVRKWGFSLFAVSSDQALISCFNCQGCSLIWQDSYVHPNSTTNFFFGLLHLPLVLIFLVLVISTGHLTLWRHWRGKDMWLLLYITLQFFCKAS
jgi:hypothetical protein